MRNASRLAAVRQLPCVKCGQDAPSQACHSNFGEHGKGKGLKAKDDYTIPLCPACHRSFDLYVWMNRQQSKDWFNRMLSKTNRMLENYDDTF